MKLLISLAAAATALSPDIATGEEKQLPACMWEKMPASTAEFVDNSDRTRDFSLMMKAVAPCGDDLPSNLNLNKLRKQLAASRPTTIGQDSATSDNASVCLPTANGAPADCKPAGE